MPMTIAIRWFRCWQIPTWRISSLSWESSDSSPNSIPGTLFPGIVGAVALVLALVGLACGRQLALWRWSALGC